VVGLTKKRLSHNCKAELSSVLSVPKNEALILSSRAARRKLSNSETRRPIQVNRTLTPFSLADFRLPILDFRFSIVYRLSCTLYGSIALNF
jgi:hypothetical protein